MTDPVKALLEYRQADADGVMVIVSRQACDECAAAIMELRLDAARYRYLRENFASAGLHGIELNWDQPDPCDALDNRLDAFIAHADGPQNAVQAAYGGLVQTPQG